MSKYNRVRLDPEIRKRQILNAALDDAIERGPYNISIISVSRRLENCSKDTVKHYYPTKTILCDAVIDEAVKTSCETVIGAAIAMKHPAFTRVDEPICEEQKQKCLSAYLNQG